MKIRVLQTFAGNSFVYGGGVYSVPEQMPKEVAEMALKAGFAIPLPDETREDKADKNAKIEKRKA
jgi:hypothetical protein